MDTSTITPRADVATVTSAPRPTPKPARVQFAEVMAKTMVSGAEGVVRALPGGPMMAVALRGGSASMPMSTMSATHATVAPEGPGGTPAGSSIPGLPGVPAIPGVGGATDPSGAADGGIQSSLQQSQDMNIYYLQIQEQVNAQNRSFTALSNVLKAEHDTVKTAIGNIR